MASISISASLPRACSCGTHYAPKKQQPHGAKPAHVVATSDVVSLKTAEELALAVSRSNEEEDDKDGPKSSTPKFMDQRWKKGTWDLNLFVRNGRIDWDGVIVAEATRRKFLEMNPEASTDQEPVLFRSSIIPWWAWLMRSYLLEAELLNGRAAMIGFFTAYAVDGLTRLDVVGQTGNFFCKVALFVTVISVIIFRRSDDLGKLKGFADEATLYVGNGNHLGRTRTKALLD